MPISISASFSHHAFYNSERHRIEMHLASKTRQKVRVAGRGIEFRAGETIHTENSYKYTLESFARPGARVGVASGLGVDRRRRKFFDPRAGVRGAVAVAQRSASEVRDWRRATRPPRIALRSMRTTG